MIEEDDINQAVLNDTGYNVKVYEDEVLFNQTVKAKIGESITSTKEEQELFIQNYQEKYGERVSELDLAVNKEYDKYIDAKRDVIKKLYSKDNHDFVKHTLNDGKTEKISYTGVYTSTIIAEVPCSMVYSIAQDETVQSIKLYEDKENSTSLNNVLSQVNADDVKGSDYNSGSGYRGTGIKIGIIEAESGRYEGTALQLNSIDGSRLFFYNFSSDVIPVDSVHATMVTSIIVGQAYTIGGKTYEGVVPNATVYQAPAKKNIHVYNALNEFASLGVTVVNYSGGISNGGQYEAYDEEVDKILYSTGMTLVVAAGNEGNTDSPYIRSPGKAYNAITVGNADTVGRVLGVRTKKNSPYDIFSESSYNLATNLTAKPDISAPGTNVAFAYKSGIKMGTGTSLAAPIVTGVVAQIMQARPTSRLKPTEIKAILLRGANNEAISSSDNTSVWKAGLIRQKSGLGLVDAKATLDYMTSSSPSAVLTYRYDLRTVSSHTSSTVSKYYSAGQTIRAVLVFDKPESTTISASGYGNDVDLVLLNSSNNEIEFSRSSYNNVEVLEYTVETSGYYHFKVVVYETITATEKVVLSATLAYGVE